MSLKIFQNTFQQNKTAFIRFGKSLERPVSDLCTRFGSTVYSFWECATGNAKNHIHDDCLRGWPWNYLLPLLRSQKHGRGFLHIPTLTIQPRRVLKVPALLQNRGTLLQHPLVLPQFPTQRQTPRHIAQPHGDLRHPHRARFLRRRISRGAVPGRQSSFVIRQCTGVIAQQLQLCRVLQSGVADFFRRVDLGQRDGLLPLHQVGVDVEGGGVVAGAGEPLTGQLGLVVGQRHVPGQAREVLNVPVTLEQEDLIVVAALAVRADGQLDVELLNAASSDGGQLRGEVVFSAQRRRLKQMTGFIFLWKKNEIISISIQISHFRILITKVE